MGPSYLLSAYLGTVAEWRLSPDATPWKGTSLPSHRFDLQGGGGSATPSLTTLQTLKPSQNGFSSGQKRKRDCLDDPPSFPSKKCKNREKAKQGESITEKRTARCVLTHLSSKWRALRGV